MNRNTAEMVFNGVCFRDAESTAQQWGNYFKNMYTDAPKPYFDMDFRRHIESFVNNIKNRNVKCDPYEPFHISGIIEQMNFLKQGKAS